MGNEKKEAPMVRDNTARTGAESKNQTTGQDVRSRASFSPAHLIRYYLTNKRTRENVSFVENQMTSLGVDVEATDKNGRNFLFYAKDEKMLAMLIKQGVKMDQRDNSGQTAREFFLAESKNEELSNHERELYRKMAILLAQTEERTQKPNALNRFAYKEPIAHKLDANSRS